jgi:hypothetical protein
MLEREALSLMCVLILYILVVTETQEVELSRSQH